jgi:pyruvate carboxylase
LRGPRRANVATIEAMKMEAAITAPKAGSIAPTAVSQIVQIGRGDMLIVLS